MYYVIRIAEGKWRVHEYDAHEAAACSTNHNRLVNSKQIS